VNAAEQQRKLLMVGSFKRVLLNVRGQDAAKHDKDSEKMVDLKNR